MYKKLTIDTNIQLKMYKALHFSEGPLKIVKIFQITVMKTSLLLCSMDWMWPKLALTTHDGKEESCRWALLNREKKDWERGKDYAAIAGGGGGGGLK